MTTAVPPALAENSPPPRDPSALGILWSQPVSAACLVIAGVYVLLAILTFTPWFEARATDTLPTTFRQPDGTELTEYAPPSAAEFPARILGTDINNRSVFYRTLYGCRTALIITVFTSILSLGIGIVLGVVAGYFGGVIDEFVTWLVATVSAVPWILLVLAMGFALKQVDLGFLPGWLGHDSGGQPREIPGLFIVILALGLTDWVGICRLIRGEVLKQRALDYVQAGKAMGFSQPRILFRHILPNTLHLVIITFTLGAVGYVQAEVALTFLGIGISDKPSWGRMIDDAKLELLRGVWWQFAAATLAIGILCLALSLLGDALRDVLDPRTRSRR
jgi:peptide/nickel transport system permease protein